MAKKRRTPKEDQLPAPLPARSALPQGYDAFLKDLKERIRAAQIKAAVAANSKLIELYWHTGQSIVERQEREGWGSSVIEPPGQGHPGGLPRRGGLFAPQYLANARVFWPTPKTCWTMA